jgi:hypothetical protein
LDATIVFLEQRGNCISLLVRFTKHRQLARKVEIVAHSRLLKEAMAPHTVGGLAHGMDNNGHIHHKNYEPIGAKGPAPMSAYSHGIDLHPRNLDPTAHDGHTLGTPLGGCIPEFTYTEGPVPSLITGCG